MRDEQAGWPSEAARGRLAVVMGDTVPRYLSVADAARVSGLSRPAVYRAIDRGELMAGLVCSRLRIHPDDFLAWMEGGRVAPRERSRTIPRVGSRKVPARDGLRTLLQDRSAAT